MEINPQLLYQLSGKLYRVTIKNIEFIFSITPLPYIDDLATLPGGSFSGDYLAISLLNMTRRTYFLDPDYKVPFGFEYIMDKFSLFEKEACYFTIILGKIIGREVRLPEDFDPETAIDKFSMYDNFPYDLSEQERNKKIDELLERYSLISVCGQDLIDPIIEYRQSMIMYPEPDQGEIIDANKFAKKALQNIERSSNNYRTNEIILTREEHWDFIIRAKLQMIEAVGGFDLMKDVYDYLKNHPKNQTPYPFEAIFNTLANGIGTWVS